MSCPDGSCELWDDTPERAFFGAARAYCVAWTRDNRNNFTDGPGREMARTRSDLFNAYKKLAESERG